MSWCVHEVKQVGLLPPILHYHGEWGAFKTNLAADFIPPVICPLVLSVQIPTLAAWCLMRLLDNHVAEESFPTVQMTANTDRADQIWCLG